MDSFPKNRKMLQVDQRHNDQYILNEQDKKNLAMALIINSLKMYKISDEVINFIMKIMETWRVELTTGRRSFAEAKLLWGIFPGDVGVNKINKIKMNFKKCRNFQKPLTRSGAMHAQKKGAILTKRRESLSLKWNPSDWKDFLPPGHKQGSMPVCQVPGGFACGLCLLLVSQHAKTSNIKTPLGMSTHNLDLLTTGDDKYISTPYFGEMTVLK